MSPSNAFDHRRRLAGFVALGVAQLVVYALAAALVDGPRHGTLAMMLALGAFALYAAALAVGRPLEGRGAFTAALLLGLAFRAVLFPEPPVLSDDYFRYLWDGAVQRAGVNPFRYAPAEPALAGLDDALRARVNHPAVPTIYPPLAQLAFLAGAILPGGWLTLKALWLACDLAIGAVLWRLVPAARRVGAWALYWWSPLVIVEVAWNAHLDLLGVLPLLAALWLAARRKRRGTLIGAALAAATLVKYFAVLLVPAAARRSGRPVRLVAAFTATVVLLYLPYASAGTRLFDGLLTYSAIWRFNESVFVALDALAPSGVAARAIAAAIVAGLTIQSVRNEWPLERSALWLVGAMLLLSPTVHPWYLLWMVPLLALRPNRAWLYLTGSVFLAYYGLAGYRAAGVWPEPWWTKLLIYGPFFLLLCVDAWRGSWWQTMWHELRRGPPVSWRRPR